MRPVLVVALVTLAGCVATPPPPPLETTRQVAGDPAQALERAGEALRRAGFSVEPAGRLALEGTVRGAARPEWASCRRIVVWDYDSSARRAHWASPGARRAEIVVRAVPAPNGARVETDADFTATYTNRYKNLGFESDCASTGVLERSVLDGVSR